MSEIHTLTTWTAARSVECPACGAWAGKPCVTTIAPRGRPMQVHHGDRYEAARQHQKDSS